jgi:type IV secretory pathway component VirB8
MYGGIEGRYIKIRKHRVAKDNKSTRVIISIIYILSLFATVLLCFYAMKQRIGGTL